MRTPIDDWATLVSEDSYQVLLRDKHKVSFTKTEVEDVVEYGRVLPSMHLFEEYGFHIQDYAEFFLTVHGAEWDKSFQIPFRIGSTFFDLGLPTPLALFSPGHYFEATYDAIGKSGFDLVAEISLSMYPVQRDHCNDLLQKALFYVNSHYFQPYGMIAKLEPVARPEMNEDPDPEGLSQRLSRRIRRRRKDFRFTEPLQLYNYACTIGGPAQFHGFFRVIEFFMPIAAIRQISELRNDQTVSAERIYQMFEKGIREREMLREVIERSLTKSMEKKLREFAINGKLMKANDSLSDKLYTFRNSIVHSKQTEIGRSTLPPSFSENSKIRKWNYVAREIAKYTLTRLNTP